MEINDLKYFLAVAKEENMRVASNSLYISQPGLTKVIQRLENELGKSLFNRTHHRLSLTEDGKLLKKRAQEIIELIDKTQNELKSQKNNLSGRIVIGCGESDGVRIITKAMKSFQDKYPNVHFQILSGNADIIREKVENGLLDFGVLLGVADLKKYDFIRLPYLDTWGVLMQKNSPFANKKSINLNDLLKMPLIYPSQTNGSPNIQNWFENKYQDLNIVASYNLIYNASLMVESGIGNAFCINKIINTFRSDKLVFIPVKPTLHSNVIFIWKKYQVFSEVNKLFLEELQREVSNL